MAGDEASDGSVTRGRVGSTGDILGVRPYRRGDSPRRIHWAQTARHDRLIVCELQTNVRPVVLLVLDADPANHSLGPNGSREWAIRIAASLARGWLEAGAQVGAAWTNTFISPASGSAQASRILDALARIPDQCSGSLAQLFDAPSVRGARAGVRVAITTDAFSARASAGDMIRFVVLDRRGFGGDVVRSMGCDEGPIRARPQPWAEFRSADRVPHDLRHGWSEARHGS